MVEQLARTRLTRVLPRGMELSHFMVLNHFARLGGEKTPAQLARVFHVTRGAMTNTLGRLDAAGYVHVRPDWEDGRAKRVSISPAGLAARDRAVAAIAPVFDDVVGGLGLERHARRPAGAAPAARAARSRLSRHRHAAQRATRAESHFSDKISLNPSIVAKRLP